MNTNKEEINYLKRNMEIVRLRAEECWTHKQLANKYEVSRQRIAQILLVNDAVISREGMLERLSKHVYEYILKYKKENDGNTPLMWYVAWECPHMHGYPRARRALDYLEQTGKIIIDKNSPLRIRVIGAKWIPPE